MIPHSPEALRIESKYIQAKMLCLNLPLQLSALIHGPLRGLLACCSHYVGTAVLTVWPAFQNGQRLRWMEKHKRQAEKRPDEDNKESEMGLKKKKEEGS